jgi:hypothetical protein
MRRYWGAVVNTDTRETFLDHMRYSTDLIASFEDVSDVQVLRVGESTTVCGRPVLCR